MATTMPFTLSTPCLADTMPRNRRRGTRATRLASKNARAQGPAGPVAAAQAPPDEAEVIDTKVTPQNALAPGNIVMLQLKSSLHWRAKNAVATVPGGTLGTVPRIITVHPVESWVVGTGTLLDEAPALLHQVFVASGKQQHGKQMLSRLEAATTFSALVTSMEALEDVDEAKDSSSSEDSGPAPVVAHAASHVVVHAVPVRVFKWCTDDGTPLSMPVAIGVGTVCVWGRFVTSWTAVSDGMALVDVGCGILADFEFDGDVASSYFVIVSMDLGDKRMSVRRTTSKDRGLPMLRLL